jgi:hypothetical protein
MTERLQQRLDVLIAAAHMPFAEAAARVAHSGAASTSLGVFNLMTGAAVLLFVVVAV